jgi:hypothetical protein
LGDDGLLGPSVSQYYLADLVTMEGTYMKKETRKMLEFYHVNSPRDSVNALKEIVQEVVLHLP